MSHEMGQGLTVSCGYVTCTRGVSVVRQRHTGNTVFYKNSFKISANDSVNSVPTNSQHPPCITSGKTAITIFCDLCQCEAKK